MSCAPSPTAPAPNGRSSRFGYAGWAPGQLDNEMQNNGWLHVGADAELVFGRDHGDKWRRAVAKVGIDPALLSGEAGHA